MADEIIETPSEIEPTEIEPTETETPADDVITEQPTETVVDTPTEELPEEPAFSPNLTYKSYGQEHQIDEWAHGLINADNNEQFTKLYEKSAGFDHLKDQFKTTESTLNDYKRAHGELAGMRDTLSGYIDKNDLHGAWRTLGLNDEQLFTLAKQRFEHSQLPAHQQQQIDQRYEYDQRERDYQAKLNSLQEQQQAFMQQQHDMEMNTTFSDPNVANAEKIFDERMGQAGAFKQYVQQMGQSHYLQTNENLPVRTVVDRAMLQAGLNTPAQVAPQVTQPVQTQTTQTLQPKPVPSVSGGRTSPVKKKIRTIADMEREYNDEYVS